MSDSDPCTMTAAELTAYIANREKQQRTELKHL